MGRDGSVRMSYLFFVGEFVYILTIKNYECENDKKNLICILGIIVLLFPTFMCIKSVEAINDFANWGIWGNWISGLVSCLAAILMWQIFKKQDDRISKNQVVTIFFDMLRTFREIRTVNINKEIDQFVEEYNGHFILNVRIEKLNIANIKSIMKLYMEIHEKGKSFHSYFRYIEQIAIYIDDYENQLDESSKKKYAKLFIALLSPNEILVIKLRIFVGQYEEFRITTLGKLLLEDTTISDKCCLNDVMEVLSMNLDILPFNISKGANEIDFGDTDVSGMNFLDAYKYFFE